MDLNDAWDAVQDAKKTIEAGHSAVRLAARLVRGNLRAASVGREALVGLKRELQKYNSRTGKWRE
jgi:hypothetical protein